MMVSSVYEYAREYQIPTVIAKAVKIIVNILEKLQINNNSVIRNSDKAFDLAFTILAFAEKYNDNEILSKAIAKIACVPGCYFKKHSTYECLSPDSKFKLLETRLDLCEKNQFFT